MYVYCNFYCSPAKKNCSDPHFFWAGDATGIYLCAATFKTLAAIAALHHWNVQKSYSLYFGINSKN